MSVDTTTEVNEYGSTLVEHHLQPFVPYRVTYRAGGWASRPKKDRSFRGEFIRSTVHRPSGERRLFFRNARGREIGVWESFVVDVSEVREEGQ